MARRRTLASCHCLFPQTGSEWLWMAIRFLNYSCLDCIFHPVIPYLYNISLLSVCISEETLHYWSFAIWNHLSLLKYNLNWEPVCQKEIPMYSNSLYSRKIEMLTSCMPRRMKMLKGSFTLTKCLHIQHSVPEVVLHTIKCGFAVVAFLG